MPDTPLKLVVGLGNPEADYGATRHNIGFLALDALMALLYDDKPEGDAREEHRGRSKRCGVQSAKKREGGLRGKTPYTKMRCEALLFEIDRSRANGERDGGILILAKPQVYMNRSGHSVKGLLKHYDLHIEEVLIIHDDLDLPAGTLRIKVGGGHGGHNGLRSIIETCGPDFARIKVGIGRPPGQMPAERYVLQPLKHDALEELKVDAARAADSALLVLKEGIVTAQNIVNSYTIL